MSGFGNTFRKTINEFIFRGGSYTAGPTYISLHTGDPGADGQTANEVSGNAYTRFTATNNSTFWAAASTADPSTIANAQAFTFPTASGGNWGTITHFGIWNHATNNAAANYIGGAALSASQVVNDGNTASFATGALVHSFDSV